MDKPNITYPTSGKDLRKMLQIYAKCRGVKLNPDERVVISVINGLSKNIKNKGFPFCPCRRVKKNPQLPPSDFLMELVCPCIHMIRDVQKHGRCLCRLFVK